MHYCLLFLIENVLGNSQNNSVETDKKGKPTIPV